MLTVNVHEAKTQLSKLLERVMNGEQIIIATVDTEITRYDVSIVW
jgi:antitoxin (DNA-binding transcriptional repressor) of toxin-antitoxin stability system